MADEKRKSEFQRDIEQLTELVTRKKKYEIYQKTFAGIIFYFTID